MRTPVPFLAALVLAACGSSDRRDSSAERGASPQSSRGPDPIVLRIPREGGRVAAYAYPRLDSAVWQSREAAPPIARVLAFDVESGQLAAVDTRGIPRRIDLRLGQVRAAARAPLDLLASADGLAIFGVADGRVTRLTPSGSDWAVRLPAAPQELYPQRDGSLLVAATRGGNGVVWQLRPPTARVTDSAAVPAAGRPVRTATGDRVYFADGDGLVGVRSRDLEPVAPLSFDAPVRSAVATPSGDRIFVAVEGSPELQVVDRYTDRVAGTIRLPGQPRDLRVDPLGRFVIARPTTGDSAWVIATGTDRLLGTVRTAWRDDLPLVLPDGAIATTTGDDVTLVDGASLRPRSTVAGGARDFWHVVRWNGFRPRAAGLDEPVEFRSGTTPGDSGAVDSTAADSVQTPPDSTVPPPDTLAARVRPAPLPVARPVRVVSESAGEVGRFETAQRRRYTVQFAAAASERQARAISARIRVEGVTLRVVPTTRDERTVWRVVAGPFPTRAEAERVGRAAGHDYWIYEGAP